ncbi:hypothetical protein H4219_002507 [Mycoemilia scoparia]|uniref:Importin N-terminal domain-containing protein n=1 Tax=Mycoemilia scoparia TaxID=417184 RepID=A0A9W7ZXE4_9FUNG|nr:hypothetical protein H4219_002507 [Mycoemilia scoparia]
MHSREGILRALDAISSQQSTVIKEAEDQLKVWETLSQFYPMMQDIYLDKTLPQVIRLLAVIYLKNGIDKYWRKTSRNALSDDDKGLIRTRALENFGEESKQISLQNSVLISRIARWDFPKGWPELITNLLSIIENVAHKPLSQRATDSVNHSIEQQALYTLHLIVKIQCSRTLAADRLVLRKISPQIFDSILKIYYNRFEEFFSVLQSGNTTLAVNILSEFRFTIKTLRRLFVYGLGDSLESNQVIQFYQKCFEALDQLYKLESTIEDKDTEEDALLRKVILIFGKMYLDFQSHANSDFMRMPGSASVLQWYWERIRQYSIKHQENPSDALDFEKLLIQGLLLFNRVIHDADQFSINSSTNNQNSQRLSSIYSQIFTPDFVKLLGETIIRSFLILNPEDLNQWEEDPEGWIINEGVDHYEVELRPCSERTFMLLFSKNKSVLIPTLVSALKNIYANDGENTVLFKDSIYNALGLCAIDLYDDINFSQWLSDRLLKDIETPGPMTAVLKRRIALLIGQWVQVQYPTAERRLGYQTLIQLSSKNEPLVVRLAAIGALKNCVDDWDFDLEAFKDHISDAMNSIVEILGTVETTECKMQAMGCMAVIIERSDKYIKPYAETLLKLLPSMWDSAQGEPLYHTSIINMVSKLALSVGSDSTKYNEVICALVSHAIDPTSPHQVYLLEDALELWHTLLQNATTLTSYMLNLYPSLPVLLENGTEHLKVLLKIAESYTMLDGSVIISEPGSMVLKVICDQLNIGLSPQAIVMTVRFIDLTMRVVPISSVGLSLESSGLLWILITHMIENKEPAITLASYASVFSRMCVQDPQAVATFIGHISSGSSGNATTATQFIEQWIQCIELSNTKQRTLGTMAMAALIGGGCPEALSHANSICTLLADLILEYKSSENENVLNYWEDSDYEGAADIGHEEICSAENKRYRKLLKEDIVHTTDILAYARAHVLKSSQQGHIQFLDQIVQAAQPGPLEELKNALS